MRSGGRCPVPKGALPCHRRRSRRCSPLTSTDCGRLRGTPPITVQASTLPLDGVLRPKYGDRVGGLSIFLTTSPTCKITGLDGHIRGFARLAGGSIVGSPYIPLRSCPKGPVKVASIVRVPICTA